MAGAGGGDRTHTPLRVLDFESSASASSATPAFSSGSEATEIVEGLQAARRTEDFAQDNRLPNAATLAKQCA